MGKNYLTQPGKWVHMRKNCIAWPRPALGEISVRWGHFQLIWTEIFCWWKLALWRDLVGMVSPPRRDNFSHMNSPLHRLFYASFAVFVIALVFITLMPCYPTKQICKRQWHWNYSCWWRNHQVSTVFTMPSAIPSAGVFCCITKAGCCFSKTSHSNAAVLLYCIVLYC